MLTRTAFLAVLLCLAAAPARAGGNFFPLCMYGITRPAELAALKKAGFNCFHTYTQEPEALAGLAAEAERQQLQMVAYPDRVIGSAYAGEAKKWPMLAWYLYDEPEVARFPPADLLKLDRRVKAWAPGQRTAFVVGTGMAAYTYGAAADVLMVDWYPVSHLKLESVGYQVTVVKDAAKKAAAEGAEKPVWAVLQAFDWKRFPQSKKERVGRFPTFDELRFMTYLALVRGAGGLFYFTFGQEDGKTLADQPDRWAYFEKLAAELNTLMPALSTGKEKIPPPGLDRRLAVKAISGGGDDYLLLLNPTDASVPLNGAALKDWRPRFEEKGSLGELLPGGGDLPPYRALVLEKN